jgi:glutamyl-tRNA reductase
LEPSLVVIGINYRTAPVAVRERFWMSETRRCEALAELVRAEGVDEAVVLSTCNRTEFVLWASELSLAANSVLNFLTREYGLKLCEWVNFYRLLDEAALQHLFRVASGLDSMVVGETEVLQHVANAWVLAQKTSTTGRNLDSVFKKTLAVAHRVRADISIGSAAVSLPRACAQLARRVLAPMQGRKLLVFGAGRMAELASRHLIENGAQVIGVVNRTQEHAVELAAKLGGEAVEFHERWRLLPQADIVLSATSCSHLVLTQPELGRACAQRGASPLLLIDAAVPRNIDPRVRDIAGVFLYDIDDLQQAVQREAGERQASLSKIDAVIVAEAKEFQRQLRQERALTGVQGLRLRLEQIGRDELQSFRRETGPFTHDYDKMLEALTSRIIHRVTGTLSRELKELSPEQEPAAAKSPAEPSLRATNR